MLINRISNVFSRAPLSSKPLSILMDLTVGPVTFFSLHLLARSLRVPPSPSTPRPLVTNSVLAELQRWRQPAASAQAAGFRRRDSEVKGFVWCACLCVCRCECMGDRDITTHQGEGRRHGEQACPPPLLRTPPLRRARVVNMGSVVSVCHILCGCFCGQCDRHANTLGSHHSPLAFLRAGRQTDRQGYATGHCSIML
jgi:hypothetical protein